MLNINPAIFKPYDIRGVYPNELNEEAAYAIGRAYARRTGAKKILVGSDMRLSGPVLKEQLIRGLTDEGADVVDTGLVPIDAVYFAVSKQDYSAGIMITASHNPKEYNGFKLPTKTGLVRGEEIKTDVDQLPIEISASKGAVTEIDIMSDYIKHVLSFCDLKKIKPFTVVVDAGNGMAGKVVPILEPYLPIKIIPLNFTLDGNFPAHPSNPLLPESQVQIKQAVLENKADFGVIFDGDTDRIFFVDEQGEFIRADMTLLILAKEFLRREPGMGIVYNVICSKVVPEIITEWGGRPIRSKVGYANIANAMKNENGIMGGELSAHYSFRDNGYADSGFIAWLILLELLSQDTRPLSAIAKEFQRYDKSDEINIKMNDRQAAINKIKAHYTDGEQDELDGLTVSYPTWWFNIRQSNTEPLLRITIETPNAEITVAKQKEILEIIKE
ncbi:MAG: phosphomannomutase/phosphoglucomutase [Patescibacteria group bacterium]